MRSKFFGSRRRTLTTGVVMAALVLVSAAAAAWFIYTGASGTIGGRTGEAQTVGALTFVAASDQLTAQEGVTPGGTGRGAFYVTNNNPNSDVTIDSVEYDPFFISSPTHCANHLSFNASNLVGLTVPAGTTNQLMKIPNLWFGSTTLPESCIGATFSVQFTGTTTP